MQMAHMQLVAYGDAIVLGAPFFHTFHPLGRQDSRVRTMRMRVLRPKRFATERVNMGRKKIVEAVSPEDVRFLCGVVVLFVVGDGFFAE